MSFLTPAPPPPSALARYRKLSARSGLHVSPIQLGAGSIGDSWAKYGMGSMDKESSFKLLDAYYDMGGNFIDTAGSYQDESSEKFIGEWAEKRGIREQLVIATKYTTPYKTADRSIKIQVNYAGNNIKNMYASVEASLKNLRTSYIDVLYIHWWDHATSIEEVMDGLHNLVLRGKVLYLGISDTPAWIVAKANTYAKYTGKTPFVIYQGQWNVMARDFERDIIPMAREEGMAIAPWGVLAGGKLRSDEEEQRRRETGENGRTFFSPNGQWERSAEEKAMSAVLDKIAKEVGTKHLGAVAIAYVLKKAPYVFPIIGGRKVEQLQANVEALTINLTDDHIQEIESAAPFDLGFPHKMIGDGSSYMAFFSSVGFYEERPILQAISASTT
ncbi:hypothetical protein ONZ45_g8358 [Pleurotus djamor]|nr:hypothetical protein ONZ45_g8358 [Pleurotus djamor]